MATKTIGGTDGMHMAGNKSPFSGGGGKASFKTARSTAAHSSAGGPKFVAANSAMKGKKPLNGKGTA